MSTILAIDIGNTNTSIGIYNKEQLIDTFRFSSDIKKTADEYGILLCSFLQHKKLKIKGAIISSVVPKLAETYKDALSKYLNISAINLSYKSKMPIQLKLDNNKEIGADRIANASGASRLYKTPIIVVDFGTARTCEFGYAEFVE